MNYNLQSKQQVPVELFNREKFDHYGSIPYGMIVDKFQENITEFDEKSEYEDYGAYGEYARRTVSDFRPDAPTFAHEEARSGVNASSGRLQLQYSGHRGFADDAAHPEAFLHDEGVEHVDPRGHSDMPLFRNAVEQQNVRMKYVRFSKEGPIEEVLTGGGRSEFQAMQDNQKIFRATRDNLKVFSQNREGMEPGKASVGPKDVSKMDLVTTGEKCNRLSSMGDHGGEDKLRAVHQRRTVKLTDKQLRDTAWFRQSNTDIEFDVARLGVAAKSRAQDMHVSGVEVNSDAINSDLDHYSARVVGDRNDKLYKSIASSMSGLVSKVNDTVGDADVVQAPGAEGFITGKTAERQKIVQLLKNITHDSDFKTSDASMIIKTAERGDGQYHDHSTQDHYTSDWRHLASQMYKSAKYSGEKGVDAHNGDNVIQDHEENFIASTGGQTHSAHKSRAPDSESAKYMVRREAITQVNGRQLGVFNYKTGRATAASNSESRTLINGENFKSESMQVRKGQNSHVMSVKPNEGAINDVRLGVNAHAERHIAPMGTKSVARRHVQREASDSESLGDF